ncbi:MAG: ketopantoate reductase family protein [Thalassovita sp.]
MKISIMGAGAIGCYFGAKLALAGHEVTLIGRPALVEAVSANGLILEMGGERITCPAKASTDASMVAGAEMVLFCVKSGDTADAGAQVAPYLQKDTLLLSLQNGISNPEILAEVTGHSVIAAVVYVASEMAGPGVVKHQGRGDLAIGGAGAESAANILRPAEIGVEVSDDVFSKLWGKLLVNCAYNALSAIPRKRYGEFADTPGVMDLIDDIIAECMTVATAEGVTIPAEALEIVRKVAEWMPDQYSSTAQDLMRGRPTEIDYLNGEIVRRAAKHGIDVPINRTLTLLTKLVEPG